MFSLIIVCMNSQDIECPLDILSDSFSCQGWGMENIHGTCNTIPSPSPSTSTELESHHLTCLSTQGQLTRLAIWRCGPEIVN